MPELVDRASHSLRRRWTHARNNATIRRINREVAAHAALRPGERPVIFFNASTRLTGLSLNAAYSLVSRWAVNLAGAPALSFACMRGLSRCVLGTDRDDASALPPCRDCTAQTLAFNAHTPLRWFYALEDRHLEGILEDLSLAELMSFEYQNVPLGPLALPSLRWVLRRHHLEDELITRHLYGHYIQSAWRVIRQFGQLLDETQPRAIVVFNGMFYPEAAARWAAWQRGLRVISHEVGLRPLSVFFTPGEATAYPISIPPDFELDERQNLRLDEYLEKRVQGNFSMAGIRFWPEMRRLDEAFLERAAGFRQVVPVFTNVIFDTSQPHSNVVFTDMFAWLSEVVDLARAYPDTLFVIRAHPDEARPGKESRESVADWVARNQVTSLPNVLFVDPQQYFSSYELIQRSKFVMVYNSTIGLEASLMGAPVLCGGKARFTQLPTVFFPPTPTAYRAQAEGFLQAGRIDVPAEFHRNARRFLYYQLFCTSLPFDEFIEEDGVWQGYVRVKDLDYRAFDPANSPVLGTIVNGILHGSEFLYDSFSQAA
jgi:hypothetical protein